MFSYKGASLRSDTYKGGTIFCDAASGYISMHNQTTFAADETVLSKLKFEREAMGVGVNVKRYCTDNGIYSSMEFMEQINKDIRSISYNLKSDNLIIHFSNSLTYLANEVRCPKIRSIIL